MTIETIEAGPPPAPPPPKVYPIRLVVWYPERQRRLTNFPLFIGFFIRMFLLIPHYVMLWLIYPLQFLAYLMSTFVITFTGRYPRGLFRLQVGAFRWQANVSAYSFHLFDEYPPLDFEQRPDWRVLFEVDYPEKPSRLLNSPVLGGLLKVLSALPHLVILYGFGFLAGVVVFIAEFAILFNGQFPAGLFQLVAGYQRWAYRVYGYLSGFTDRYPAFSPW